MKELNLFLLYVLLSIASSNEKQWIIQDIVFIGNKTLSREKLLDQIQSKPPSFLKKSEFSSVQLQMDTDQLKRFYQNRGFFDADIKNSVIVDSTNHSVIIVFTIDEGIRAVVDSVRFVGNVFYSNSVFSDLIDIKKGQVLDSSLYTTAQTKIRELLISKGRLLARVEHFLVFDSSGKTADLIFTINEGPVVKAGDRHTAGLSKVDQSVVIRELQFDSGKVVTIDKIRTSVRKLYATGLFDMVNIIPIDTQSYPTEIDTLTLPFIVEVEEGDLFVINLGGGYNSIDNWFGTGELAYQNLFGLGHRIAFLTKLSTIVQLAQIDYSYPWLFEREFTGEMNLFIERRKQQSFTGLYQGVVLALNGNLGLKNRYRFWTSIKHTGWIKEQEPNLEKPNTILIGSRFLRDTRRSNTDPGIAYYSNLETELAGLALSWGNQFYRIKFDLRGYFQLLYTHLSFSSAIFAGYVNNFGESPIVPLSELLRIGIDEVRPIRGYTEQEVSPTNNEGEATGGKLVTIINLLNLRFPLFNILSGEFFIDGGFAWSQFNQFKFSNILWSAGPGLLITLPTSIFRIDYGFKLQRPFGLNGGWYFGIGHAF